MEADGDALSGHEIPCSDHAKLNKDGSCKGHPKCAAGLARKEAHKTLTKAEAAELRAEKKAAKVAKTALRFTPSPRQLCIHSSPSSRRFLTHTDTVDSRR